MAVAAVVAAGEALSQAVLAQLPEELAKRPHAFSVLAFVNGDASGLAEQLEHALVGGASSGYYAMMPGESKLIWTKSAPEVLALGQLCGVSLAKPPEPITPTQAKKLVDPAVLEMYSGRTRASLKLVPVDTVGTRKVFGGNS